MIIALPIGPEEDKYFINQAYVDYVKTAGYEPLLVAPENNPNSIANYADGLLLPGGKDIDPIFYGEDNWASQWCDAKKDEFERNLFWAFAPTGKPIFGICRGFQLIAREYIFNNRELSVTKSSETTVEERLVYEQHIGDHSQSEFFKIRRSMPSHFVVARDDLLYGSEEKVPNYTSVNSMHHQYVHLHREDHQLWKSTKVTPHIWVTAWTSRGLDKDDSGLVCEGFIIKDWTPSPIAGVQWHPEEMMDIQLIQHHFGHEEKVSEKKNA